VYAGPCGNHLTYVLFHPNNFRQYLFCKEENGIPDRWRSLLKLEELIWTQTLRSQDNCRLAQSSACLLSWPLLARSKLFYNSGLCCWEFSLSDSHLSAFPINCLPLSLRPYTNHVWGFSFINESRNVCKNHHCLKNSEESREKMIYFSPVNFKPQNEKRCGSSFLWITGTQLIQDSSRGQQ
jgi:hypothetical protein